jgi:o-succinylbenzoate synthase
VRIERAELLRFALPLKAPLASARGTLRERRGLLVRLHADGLAGAGEATPLPEHGTESLEACETALHLASSRALARGAQPLEAHLAALDLDAPRCPAARFALETALLDLASRAAGVALATWLAGKAHASQACVEVNALLAEQAPAALASEAARLVALGFGTLKLKVASGPLAADLERVEAVRAAVGVGPRLRIDANGAWSLAQAEEALGELAPFGIELVEQPIAPHDVKGMARLRARARIPVAADEALSDPGTRERVLAERAAGVLVLKPAVLGGVRTSMCLAARAQAAGLRALVTSTLDGSIARAAALALAAALPARPLACGLATGDLLARDLGPGPQPRGGFLRFPHGSGLGVAPDAEALAQVSGSAWEELRPTCC